MFYSAAISMLVAGVYYLFKLINYQKDEHMLSIRWFIDLVAKQTCS